MPRTIANWREVGSAVVGGSSGGFGGATGLGAGTFGAGAFGAGAFGAGALSSVRLACCARSKADDFAFCAVALCTRSKAAIESALMFAAGSQVSSDRVKPAQCTRYWTSWPRFLLPSRALTTKHPSLANSASFASVATSGTAHDQGPSLRVAVLILQYHCAGSGKADAGKSLHLLHRSHCAHVSMSSETSVAIRFAAARASWHTGESCRKFHRGEIRDATRANQLPPPHTAPPHTQAPPRRLGVRSLFEPSAPPRRPPSRAQCRAQQGPCSGVGWRQCQCPASLASPAPVAPGAKCVPSE